MVGKTKLPVWVSGVVGQLGRHAVHHDHGQVVELRDAAWKASSLCRHANFVEINCAVSAVMAK